MIFQLQPQLKIFIMPNIYSSTISHTGQMIAPPQKKIITIHNVAILVPHDELVMKSYMHVRLAIVATHYHNLNDNIKNQDYWLLTSDVGIKIQKALNCLQHRTKKHFGHFQFAQHYKEHHNMVYTIKFHLMATF